MKKKELLDEVIFFPFEIETESFFGFPNLLVTRLAKHLKVQQKRKEEQCPGRRRRFYQLRPFCSTLSPPLLSLSCPPPAPSSPLTFNFAPPTLLICPLSGKFVKQCWSSPSWPDLISGPSQLDFDAGSAETGCNGRFVRAHKTPEKLPAASSDPPNYLASPSKTTWPAKPRRPVQ